MAKFDLTGLVQTVTGAITPDKMGMTSTHEHLLVDITELRPPPREASAREMFYGPVTQESLAYARHYDTLIAENIRLRSIETAVYELKLLKQHGGGTVVEATTIGIGRDPVGLARIAREVGFNIVMGASYYVGLMHPADMDKKTEDDILNEIVSDITVGVGRTGIKAGVIGEVGCSWPLTPNERKVLRASGRAQKATGAGLLIHPGRNVAACMEVVGILREVGADLNRTIIAHMDRNYADRESMRKLAETGVYLEWDLFGREVSYYDQNPAFDMPSDARRMNDIKYLVDEGFGERVVIAHDIYTKDRLVSYGGHGYMYIVKNIVPRLRQRGFTGDQVNKIMVENPARVLTFVKPG
ncbi:MAG: aryldialkylphosphatase [SAR202 cluster bacterium]|nr:aryldialkylphosphatase [SAR202 cluster bacterium]